MRTDERDERGGQSVGSGWDGSVDRVGTAIPHVTESVRVIR